MFAQLLGICTHKSLSSFPYYFPYFWTFILREWTQFIAYSSTGLPPSSILLKRMLCYIFHTLERKGIKTRRLWIHLRGWNKHQVSALFDIRKGGFQGTASFSLHFLEQKMYRMRETLLLESVGTGLWAQYGMQLPPLSVLNIMYNCKDFFTVVWRLYAEIVILISIIVFRISESLFTGAHSI